MQNYLEEPKNQLGALTSKPINWKNPQNTYEKVGKHQ